MGMTDVSPDEAFQSGYVSGKKRKRICFFFETERLIIRNVCREDAKVMYDYRNNEICARYQRGQTKD